METGDPPEVPAGEARGGPAAARAAEERFRTLVAALPDAVAITDLEGRVEFASPLAIRLLGLSGPGEAVGRSALEFIAPEDRARAQDNLRKTAAEGQVREVQYNFLKRNGAMFPGELSAVLVRDAGGQPASFIAIIRDITERLEAEDRLRRFGAQHAGILEAIPVAVGVSIEEGRNVYTNLAMQGIFGYTAAEALAVPIASHYVNPEDRIRMLADLARDGSIRDREVGLRHRDGTALTALLNVDIVEWNGAPARMASLRDVTEAKLTEGRLREQADQLRLLTDRLAAVAEAERAEFARMLHDAMGQNLTGLSFQLHALLGGPRPATDPGVRERLLECLSMVSDMADASRELGDNLRPSVLDDYGLDAAVRAWGDRFTARTGIALRHRTAEVFGLRLAREAEIALFRIVQEALANAARHAKATEIVVSMDGSPEVFRLEVADNGAGFDLAAPQAEGGRGAMGIPIMQRRAESVRGSFRIESRPGLGTSVIVEVPR
ncbi:MAG: PAS domain S-box protein [Candidatus Coatesbacteria bacterium]